MVKEYGAIPHIECRLSQLSQDVLNLLVNAAHANGAHGSFWVRSGSVVVLVWVVFVVFGLGFVFVFLLCFFVFFFLF